MEIKLFNLMIYINDSNSISVSLNSNLDLVTKTSNNFLKYFLVSSSNKHH